MEANLVTRANQTESYRMCPKIGKIVLTTPKRDGERCCCVCGVVHSSAPLKKAEEPKKDADKSGKAEAAGKGKKQKK